MKSSVRFALAGVVVVALAVVAALAQEGGKAEFRSMAELDAHYRKQAEELDRRRLLDMAALAGRLTDTEAEAAYRAVFDMAVARGLFSEAESAARTYLGREGGPPQSQALAALISLIARADRGEYDRSLADLEAFVKRRAALQIPEEQRLPPPLLFEIGEAYLQRLIQGGRHDIARKVCQIAVAARSDPEIKAHFEKRRSRLEMIGKIAPEIEGKDVDGKPVRLADLKGKVVLVDFWATWCPPCVASFPVLRQLAREYKDRGFAILGVNLDDLARPESGPAAARTEPAPGPAPGDLRSFLVSQRLGWTNLVGAGADAAARAYGVDDIPASFLLDREGKIIQVELRDQALARTLARLLGGPAAKP
jgi:thiol-disulfide isomerase/thioredoxin